MSTDLVQGRHARGAITASIYGASPLYSGGLTAIDDLKASGFTTVVACAVHVSTAGDLIYNDPTVVSGGTYVGPAAWPGQLTGLKKGTTSVNRLLFSIGGRGTSDFANIQSLIQSQGTGPNSILYKNFQALKAAIPTIDGIDLDDESNYDQDSTVAFSLMLKTLGYQVTFCPYTETDYWLDCLYSLNKQAPGLVTGFNLQCYAGGAGSNPRTWIEAVSKKMGSRFDASGFVFPGLWCSNGDGCTQGQCPDSIASQFASWKPDGIQGGFIWLYDDILSCENSGVCSGGMGSAAYASAIASGLS